MGNRPSVHSRRRRLPNKPREPPVPSNVSRWNHKREARSRYYIVVDGTKEKSHQAMSGHVQEHISRSKLRINFGTIKNSSLHLHRTKGEGSESTEDENRKVDTEQEVP